MVAGGGVFDDAFVTCLDDHDYSDFFFLPLSRYLFLGFMFRVPNFEKKRNQMSV